METRCPIPYDYYCKHVNVISLVLIILNIHLFAQIFNLKVLGRFLSNSASKVKLINLASFVPKRSLVVHHKLLRLSPTQSRRRLRRIDLSNTNQPASILQLRTAFCIQWVQLSQLKSEQFQIKSSFKVGEKNLPFVGVFAFGKFPDSDIHFCQSFVAVSLFLKCLPHLNQTEISSVLTKES